jgi:hypothetical protein
MVWEMGWESGVDDMARGVGMAGEGNFEIGSVAPAAGTRFTGEESDECKARPLAKTEGLEQLLFGVLERRIYGVNGRDWQGAPC